MADLFFSISSRKPVFYPLVSARNSKLREKKCPAAKERGGRPQRQHKGASTRPVETRESPRGTSPQCVVARHRGGQRRLFVRASALSPPHPTRLHSRCLYTSRCRGTLEGTRFSHHTATRTSAQTQKRVAQEKQDHRQTNSRQIRTVKCSAKNVHTREGEKKRKKKRKAGPGLLLLPY